jgi:hypothetical protein
METNIFRCGGTRHRVLLVLVMLVHERRWIVHCHVTEHPTAAWTAQQIVDAFPWDEAPRYLLRDRDRIYGDVFGQWVRNMGTPVARPVQLPKFGRVREVPEVGGLPHHYERMAA